MKLEFGLYVKFRVNSLLFARAIGGQIFLLEERKINLLFSSNDIISFMKRNWKLGTSYEEREFKPFENTKVSKMRISFETSFLSELSLRYEAPLFTPFFFSGSYISNFIETRMTKRKGNDAMVFPAT